MYQIRRSGASADVVVIGSGAGGGTVVKVLTDLGVSVTLLEAGGPVDPRQDFLQGVWPYEIAHRGAGPKGEYYDGKQETNFYLAPNGAWQIEGEPYTVAEGEKFRWYRSRIVGGRTNQFGRVMPRFSEYDFRGYSTDGLGVDWPIGYDDLAPYYDKVEEFVGITGTEEGLRSAPAGRFQSPAPPRVHESLLKLAGKKLGLPVIPARLAMLREPKPGRAACHYCGQCVRGCKTGAAFSASQAMVAPAVGTGRLTLITGAMARELTLDAQGHVNAVVYIDKATGEERRIACRTVVLAASACESARLLLNSKPASFPNGLANGSGAVGRWLTDTPMHTVYGLVPALEDLPRHNSDGQGSGHVYVPWFMQEDRNRDFPRGYHLQVSGGFTMPGIGNLSPLAYLADGYGASLKRAMRRTYGSLMWLTGFGEMVPNEGSYCEIDPNGAVDRYGIPVLRFHWKWSQMEVNQVGHMHLAAKAIFETMGGTALEDPNEPNERRISTGGAGIHEMGTVRMGDNPADSPLNRWCQAHEVKNLFVADGAPFASNPEKNPTLTIMALAWRTAEYLAEEMRKGNV